MAEFCRLRSLVAAAKQLFRRLSSDKGRGPGAPNGKRDFVDAWNPPSTENGLLGESEWNGRKAQDQVVRVNLTERYKPVLLAIGNSGGSFAFPWSLSML